MVPEESLLYILALIDCVARMHFLAPLQPLSVMSECSAARSSMWLGQDLEEG